MRTRAAAVLVTIGALVGCTVTGAERELPGPEDMYDVAGDADATVDEIVAAGRAVDVARSGDGQFVVSWLVTSDDDEGRQAGAWRLYDERGDEVAQAHGVAASEASASPQVWGLDEGFLLQPDRHAQRYQVIDPDGAVHDVPFEPAPTPTAAGDLALLGEFDYVRRPRGPEFFRPSTRTLHRLPGRPRGERDLAIDADGGVWLLQGEQAGRFSVLHSPDGSPPWRPSAIAVPESGFPLSLTVVGERVVVATARSGGDDVLDALHVRRTDGPPTAPWRRIPADVRPDATWFGAMVHPLPSGRLLVGDWGDLWFVVEPRAGSWSRLRLPRRGGSFEVSTVGDRLVALGTEPTAPYVSDDGGRSWTQLPR